MQLLRHGSRADHGAAVMFEKSNPKITWDQNVKSVRISIPYVRDVDQKGVRHDYYLSLSIDDVQQIVGALADGAR